jgi:hypothetical protein
MKIKIIGKYSKLFPNLIREEIRFISCIVLIQRLWRQKKVKEFINDFRSPRNIQNSKDLLCRK